ncbi:nitroreductase family protein [Acinetobacter sp. 3657]|uniref:nitroreductase family protein n=1 Tax=Acinetobacter sp. 3657 TaxID=2817764 RepID=UPI0032B705D1
MSKLRVIKAFIKLNLKKLDHNFTKFALKSFFLSNFYYLFRNKFSWEHRAVLAGKVDFNNGLVKPSANTGLLRRNIHRLEKGLLMRPRRTPFGLNYIADTVYAYERALSSNVGLDELIWARDVLIEYMSITPKEANIDHLRIIVQNVSKQIKDINECERKKIPYLRLESEKPNIDYEELMKLAEYRRSVRWFLQDRVDREIINKAIMLAAYSPTACNRQPYEFRVFDDQQLVSEIIKLPMGTAGFGHQVPHVAVVLGKLRNYFDERDRHVIYIDGSLAIMSFINALEVQGISSCCINWPEVPELEQKMMNFLKLDYDERPIMLIAFGYADPEGMVANSAKKSISQLVKYNFEG